MTENILTLNPVQKWNGAWSHVSALFAASVFLDTHIFLQVQTHVHHCLYINTTRFAHESSEIQRLSFMNPALRVPFNPVRSLVEKQDLLFLYYTTLESFL